MNGVGSGALAHLPSGRFTANAAWLVCAAIAHNLTRAAAALASLFHAKARTATIRHKVIAVPARLARSARTLTLHLPRDWPTEHVWQQLFDRALHGPPVTPDPPTAREGQTGDSRGNAGQTGGTNTPGTGNGSPTPISTPQQRERWIEAES
jgi:hypothetical protein